MCMVFFVLSKPSKISTIFFVTLLVKGNALRSPGMYQDDPSLSSYKNSKKKNKNILNSIHSFFPRGEMVTRRHSCSLYSLPLLWCKLETAPSTSSTNPKPMSLCPGTLALHMQMCPLHFSRNCRPNQAIPSKVIPSLYVGHLNSWLNSPDTTFVINTTWITLGAH